MKHGMKRRTVLAAVLPAAILLGGATAHAQDPTAPTQQENPTPAKPDQNPQNPNQTAKTGVNAEPDSTSVEHPPVVVNTTPPIRQVDAAGFLTPLASPFRIGPVFLGSAQFAEILDRGTPFNTTNSATGNFQAAASQFVLHIILDKQFRKTHLAFQYVPRATIVNGQFIGDFVNQDLGANLVFALSPRLTLNLGEHFMYYKSSNSFADIFLSADPTTGVTLQKDFLQGESSWLTNSVTASFGYAVSARTRLTIAPQYVYARTSGLATGTTIPSVNEYGVNVSISHDLSPRSTVTGLYTERTDLFFGQGYNTIYQTMQAGYSYLFNGGWSISGTFGAITYNRPTGRAWSQAGSVSVTKKFRRSQLGLAYYRGHEFSGYISAAFNDRVDVNYLQNVGRRWSFGAGAGYLRDVVPANGIWGKYVEGDITFHMTRSLSLFSSYVRKWQAGDNVAVFTGMTDYARVGISWSPAAHNQ